MLCCNRVTVLVYTNQDDAHTPRVQYEYVTGNRDILMNIIPVGKSLNNI